MITFAVILSNNEPSVRRSRTGEILSMALFLVLSVLYFSPTRPVVGSSLLQVLSFKQRFCSNQLRVSRSF
jgi:hypothetical protein